MFSNAMISCIESFAKVASIAAFEHWACSVRDAMAFPLLYRIHVDGRKRFEYVTGGRVSPFLKIFRYLSVDGA